MSFIDLPDDVLFKITSQISKHILYRLCRKFRTGKVIPSVIYNSLNDLYSNKEIDIFETFMYMTVDTYKQVDFSRISWYHNNDLDYIDDHLQCAIYTGNIKLVTYLIKPNQLNYSHLIHSRGDINMLKLLHTMNPRDYSIMYNACKQGHIEIIRYLINRGVRVTYEDLLAVTDYYVIKYILLMQSFPDVILNRLMVETIKASQDETTRYILKFTKADIYTMETLLVMNNIDTFIYIICGSFITEVTKNKLPYIAARNNNLKVLTYLHSIVPLEYMEDAMPVACLYDNKEMIEYLLDIFKCRNIVTYVANI